MDFSTAHKLRMGFFFFFLLHFLTAGKSIRVLHDVKTFTIWSVREKSASFV